MGKAWKELDLKGGGLQSANLRLAALLKQRRTAYALLALFPLGLHRDYLRDGRGAWLYRSAAVLCVAALLGGYAAAAATGLGLLAACALRDGWRMDDVVARVNKQLRMQVYLGAAPGAPADFAGHYTDALGEGEHATPTVAPAGAAARPSGPSFAEQEKLLREISAGRGKRGE